jgi:hypothetical protein
LKERNQEIYPSRAYSKTILYKQQRERERERETRGELPVGVLGEEKHLQRLLPLHLISHSTQESMKPNCQ